ncbi:MAG: BlaI/MecI/CopY family transcriptional regulator [Bacteroidaceae bacterium]|nr:BlaI/MecI/CopY family transcriptional regulator [Bacteroidaceae bacterium]
MKTLTAKEEELMRIFWEHGAMFVREILDLYDEPKPHFNTISTIVRGLEEKGYVAHKQYGKTYQYYPTVTAEDMGNASLKNIIKRYFNNSYLGVVSSLVTEENISIEELRELIERVENANKTK